MEAEMFRSLKPTIPWFAKFAMEPKPNCLFYTWKVWYFSVWLNFIIACMHSNKITIIFPFLYWYIYRGRSCGMYSLMPELDIKNLTLKNKYRRGYSTRAWSKHTCIWRLYISLYGDYKFHCMYILDQKTFCYILLPSFVQNEMRAAWYVYWSSIWNIFLHL